VVPGGAVVHGVFLYGTVFWLGTLDAAVVARDTAVEVMQDPVIVAGSDGRIRDLNPAAEELLPSDAVGSSLSNVFPLLEVGGWNTRYRSAGGSSTSKRTRSPTPRDRSRARVPAP